MIAIVAMVIDHAGYVFFQNDIIMRSIGRIVFPIFAYQIAIGYIYTKNPKKYMFRLAVFALISQIPYTLLFDTTTLNVLVTLLLGLLVIYCLDNNLKLFIPFLLVVSIFVPMDYGIYGVLLPVIIYVAKNSPKWTVVIAVFILTMIYSLQINVIYQMFAVVGIIIALYLPLPNQRIKLPRYFFYAFYPAHLIVLFLIKIWM